MSKAAQGVGKAVHCGNAAAAECRALSTQQKNALRKIFDRQAFTPEDVAQLGYRRLQQAEGIGRKGLQSIIDWLQQFGLVLTPPEPPAQPKPSTRKVMRSVEQAMRLLRTHGYEVVPGHPERKHDLQAD